MVVLILAIVAGVVIGQAKKPDTGGQASTAIVGSYTYVYDYAGVLTDETMEHIDAMSDLRQGIRLRAYAQTDPIIAYKKESLEMFEEMIAAIQDETVRRLYSVRLQKNEEVKRQRVANATSESVGGDGTVKKQPRKVKKIGRNEPCPCGSGKKYKNCCGRNA